jgi:hypothetical protein
VFETRGPVVHEAGGRMGICKGKEKPAMQHSRWPVWFHHSCCRFRSRSPVASIVRSPSNEGRQDGWCRRRRRAIWSVEGRPGVGLALRRVTDAANSATDSLFGIWSLCRLVVVLSRALAALILFLPLLFSVLAVSLMPDLGNRRCA